MKKSRLDEMMIDLGLALDREEAKRWIMAGQVLVDDQRIEKPGTLIKADSTLRIKKKSGLFVSRAGDKLEGALKHWDLDVADLTALDLGASTGGFTDCLLKRGASKVYAVDVGANQLDYRLRVDPRVVSLERTHAKKLNKELIPEAIELVVVDVSFTSLKYVLPFVFPLLSENAWALCLYKPQFEVARELVGKGGIVDEQHTPAALADMRAWFESKNVEIKAEMKSPVKGRDGNQEYLFYLNLAAVKP